MSKGSLFIGDEVKQLPVLSCLSIVRAAWSRVRVGSLLHKVQIMSSQRTRGSQWANLTWHFKSDRHLEGAVDRLSPCDRVVEFLQWRLVAIAGSRKVPAANDTWRPARETCERTGAANFRPCQSSDPARAA
jgi:hypothetical protein